MKSRLPPLLILATIAPAIAAAQSTGTLTGTVTDAEGKPVVGATIKVKGTIPLRGAVSQQDGSYRVVGIGDGIYTVMVTAVGYSAEIREEIRIRAGDTTTLALRFKADSGSSDNIVRCHPRLGPSTPMKVQSILREDIQRSSRTSIFGEP